MVTLPSTLFVIDSPFALNGGTYCSTLGSSWWRFAEKIATRCDSATLYVPLAEDDMRLTGPVADLHRFRVVGRPYYEHIHQYYLRLPAMWRELRRQAQQLVSQHQLVILRLPAAGPMFVVHEAARAGKPIVMLVSGDITRTSVRNVRQPALVTWVRRLGTWFLRRREIGTARHCVLVGAWGDELREQFRPHCPRVELCQGPNIERHELTWRADTCLQRPIRLLCACRLLRFKGIEFLLEAIVALIRRDKPVVLDIAGGSDDPGYLPSLRRQAERLGLRDRVVFHGHVAFGEQLFELYRAADIYVISSLGEGIPRCIAEARAFCVPAVATAVGGIPSVVHDGEDGLLVAPRDAEALASGISRLIDDSTLRRRIISNGFELANRSTAEYHAERLTRLIAEAIASAPT